METQNPAFVLKNQTMLQDRYRIDDVLDTNGMTITYLAFDTFREQKVVIKELFPDSIVERRQDDQLTVACVHYIDENDFNTMKEHMVKKAKKLIGLYPLEGIANILNVFEANQTVYVITEYAEGVSPLEFMQKIHSHPMQLKEILRLLNPVMDALDKLHEKGIVHGRIQPSLIRTKDKKVVLVGFGDPIEDAMLPVLEEATVRVPEYAAMEQYMEQGTLTAETDIYAMAAIIYESITRMKVAPFYKRVDNDGDEFEDPVVSLKELQAPLMSFQSDAIMKALSLYQQDRYHSFDEFRKALSDEEFHEVRPLIMHKKPVYFDQKHKYIRLVRTVLVLGVLFLLLFFGPKTYRYFHASGAKQFYQTLDEKNVYEQCRMIVELSENKRATYANDFNQIEEPDISGNTTTPYQIHYYDKVTRRFVTNDEMNLDAKIVRYIRLDYRRNQTAILTFYDNGEARQVTVDLNPDMFDVYSVQESITDKNGNITYQDYKVEW